jgi:hypothetical protein
MKTLLKYSLLAALVVGLNSAAYAKPDKHPKDPDPPHTAPEVDAALAAGGLALLGGTIAVLRARRAR